MTPAEGAVLADFHRFAAGFFAVGRSAVVVESGRPGEMLKFCAPRAMAPSEGKVC